MGDARRRCAVTALTIALTAVVVSAFATIANSPSGMIAAQSITMAVAVGVAVIGTGVTATCAAAVATAITAAITAAITTTVSAAVTTAVTTTTAISASVTVLRIGGVHDREVNRE